MSFIKPTLLFISINCGNTNGKVDIRHELVRLTSDSSQNEQLWAIYSHFCLNQFFVLAMTHCRYNKAII